MNVIYAALLLVYFTAAGFAEEPLEEQPKITALEQYEKDHCTLAIGESFERYEGRNIRIHINGVTIVEGLLDQESIQYFGIVSGEVVGQFPFHEHSIYQVSMFIDDNHHFSTEVRLDPQLGFDEGYLLVNVSIGDEGEVMPSLGFYKSLALD